jgi:TetR/AcrR family transcriptional regulator, tetracycline repressor protein
MYKLCTVYHMGRMSDLSIPRRRRGPARSLDLDRIVDEALVLLDGAGPGAMSIRAVAVRLGVRPNALYTYVVDRAGLERAVAERVLSGSDLSLLSAPGVAWRDRLREYALALRATLLAHPGAPALLMSAPMDGPTAVLIGELVLAALEEGGVDPTVATRATYLLIVLVIGSAALEVAETDGRAPLPDEQVRIAARRTALGAIDPAMLPRTAAAVDVMATWIGEEQLRWSLETVLDAIAGRSVEPDPSPPPRRTPRPRRSP